MSTALNRFEVLLPQYPEGSAGNTAVQAFLVEMGSITTFFVSRVSQIAANNAETEGAIVWGALNTAQSLSALMALETLNTALGITLPCISWSVNTEP